MQDMYGSFGLALTDRCYNFWGSAEVHLMAVSSWLYNRCGWCGCGLCDSTERVAVDSSQYCAETQLVGKMQIFSMSFSVHIRGIDIFKMHQRVDQFPTRGTFFHRNSNSIEIGFYCSTIVGHNIATNFAHATTAQLSSYLQAFVTITSLQLGWEQNELSIQFELRWKLCCELITLLVQVLYYIVLYADLSLLKAEPLSGSVLNLQMCTIES